MSGFLCEVLKQDFGTGPNTASTGFEEATMTRSVTLSLLLCMGRLSAQQPVHPPKTWDTHALEDWATPLASINIRPGHFSEDEYYRAPVDNYRTYPVYSPDKEPPGYWEALKNKKPEPLVDLTKTGPSFDWVGAGQRTWNELDVAFFRLLDAESIAMARSPKYFRENRERIHIRPDGTTAIYRWVVTPEGIGLGTAACASCHTRYLRDGTVIPGAGLVQLTSDPLLGRMLARLLKTTYIGDTQQVANYRQFGVPWLTEDLHLKLKTLSDEDTLHLFDAQIPGVSDRPNGSPYYMTKIPDLTGIRDRKYIDHTATHQHRNIGDLMRYAALVEYSDAMDFGSHRLLTDAQRKIHLRWPDELLYALARYIYSLQPPANPNPRNRAATEGEKIFARVGCVACHTPPLYTNNKLTLAQAFKPSSNHPLHGDIMDISVGSDPNLALKTRKGTGLYKVPSLRGVWYRGLYGHDGAVASLEEWFDPARLRGDHVPGGFKGVGVISRGIPGHEFGLNLPPTEKAALIAFLRTL